MCVCVYIGYIEIIVYMLCIKYNIYNSSYIFIYYVLAPYRDLGRTYIMYNIIFGILPEHIFYIFIYYISKYVHI